MVRCLLAWMLLLLVMASTANVSRAQEDDSLPPLGTAMEGDELPALEPGSEAEEVRRTEGEALPSPEPDLEEGGSPEIEAGEDLPIVRAIVEQHGGRVDCRSELGQGSTFRFSLPCRTPPPE